MVKGKITFLQFLRKKLLRLIDYGLFGEETFADLGKNAKTQKPQNFLPQTLSSLKVPEEHQRYGNLFL